MIRYYRNLPWSFANPLRSRVNVKTLVIWVFTLCISTLMLRDVPLCSIQGENDRALEKNLNDGLERWVSDVTIKFIPDANHWVQQVQVPSHQWCAL